MNVHAHSYILNHVLGNSASMQGIMITMHVYTSKQCMFTILRLWIILKPLLWYFNHWHKSTHPFARLHRVNYACILNNKEIDKIYEQELKHAACIAIVHDLYQTTLCMYIHYYYGHVHFIVCSYTGIPFLLCTTMCAHLLTENIIIIDNYYSLYIISLYMMR